MRQKTSKHKKDFVVIFTVIFVILYAHYTLIKGISYGCNYRIITAIDEPARLKIIKKFKEEFESNKKTCSVLIVDGTIDNNREWVIVGFNDKGEFKKVLIDDVNDELVMELNKEGANRDAIIELAALYLDRVPLNGIPERGIDTGPNTNIDDDLKIYTPSKVYETVSKAPSIVSVITKDDIKNLGARTLTDVLRVVPGIDILKGGDFGVVDIGVRGVQDTQIATRKIKLLIDGHSVNSPLDGDMSDFFDDLPLINVKQIEIIRGPGSALYGANAFLAVINVITYDLEDIYGIYVKSGFGSFDTQEYSIMYGNSLYGIDIVGFVHFLNTNGLSDTIKSDSLSLRKYTSQFSITPGDTDDSRNKLDMDLKMSYKDFEFKAKYINKDTEPFVGSEYALTDDNDLYYNFVMAELRYKFDLTEKISVNPRIYYDQYDLEYDLKALPDGFTIPFDRDGDGDIEVFADGAVGDAKVTNRRLGSEVQIDYKLFPHNLFTLGFNYEWEKQDNVTFSSSFDPKSFASIGSIENFTNTANWMRDEATRQIWAIYIQNKWDITNDIGLTIGIRHDHYSDFEGTTNPRVGLVCNLTDQATLKLLYGQAFRAPSFIELYATNNPVLNGNTNLKPETIRTYEVGLGYRPEKYLRTNVNYFFNIIRDEISVVPSVLPFRPGVLANIGGSNIQGVEFEVYADLSHIWEKGLSVIANYTYQDAESKGDPLPNVPKHKGNVRLNFGLGKYLNANVQAFISGDRVREEADTRDDSPGYAIVDLTLIAKEFFNNLEVKASLFNLFDKNYNDPAPMNTIHHDLPRPGRSFFLEFSYDF